ncbi:MAG: hypothetical protein IT185_03800 [Acidobacteria bacterium]|nr:hypothetical protein [Acidobacteriota bacterium]
MNVIGWLFCLALVQQAPAAPQPVDPEVRARFSVTVTASEAVTARVYEYLMLVARRNTLRAKFGTPGTKSELELVLLFEKYPKMPWNRRDIGSVNLRLSPETDSAMVEYCLRRCTEPDADLVVYKSTLDDFLKRLDEASAALAKRYR